MNILGTVYMYILNTSKKDKAVIPFVQDYEVSVAWPNKLEIKVYEKALLGRVYIDTLGQNAYFDKDGFVLEMSSKVIEGIPKISGLDVEQIVLYEKLPIKGKNVLKNLLSLTQMLKKYEHVPESIKYSKEGNYTLKYQGITVLLGQAQKLNEKIVRLTYVLTKLDGTAKGGIVLAIKEDVNIPVKFIGLGETMNDLETFDIENYIYGLFKDMMR